MIFGKLKKRVDTMEAYLAAKAAREIAERPETHLINYGVLEKFARGEMVDLAAARQEVAALLRRERADGR
jgi:hypothetical protein